LLSEATPGEWRAWKRGNCSLANGDVVGQSYLEGPERPYDPVSYWHRTEEAKRRNVMTDADADFIVALRNAAEALLAAAEERARLRDALALPSGSVAGQYLSASIGDLVRRCEVHIAEEQERPLPDNALIGTLCDAVRFAREHVATTMRRLALAAPEPTDGE
jgi:hypothetical protein